MKMKTFKQFLIENKKQLTESKQVGTLYHLTNLDGIEFIMKNNKLVRKLYDGISFTRNKMLNFYEGHPSRLYFKLMLFNSLKMLVASFSRVNLSLSVFKFKTPKNPIVTKIIMVIKISFIIKYSRN